MAVNSTFFRLTSSFGKRSLLIKITAKNSASVQACLPFSTTTSCTQELVSRKMVPNEGFWKKNERMQRPMSPHLTIYKFELPSLLSITHRATGFALSGVVAAIGVGSLVLPGSPSSYIDLIQSLQLPIWLLAPAKCLLIWPVVYHTLNGVRHLTWDTGRGFEMKTLYKSGYFVVATSLLTTLVIVAYLYQ